MIVNTNEWWIDTDVLKGKPILDVYHSDEGGWQALYYHSDEVKPAATSCNVSFHTVMTLDPDMIDILDLEVGNGSRRESTKEHW